MELVTAKGNQWNESTKIKLNLSGGPATTQLFHSTFSLRMGKLIEKLNCCGGGPPQRNEWMKSALLALFLWWVMAAASGRGSAKGRGRRERELIDWFHSFGEVWEWNESLEWNEFNEGWVEWMPMEKMNETPHQGANSPAASQHEIQSKHFIHWIVWWIEWR